ncbi:MAG: ATP-binding cassette domain-containing protein [Acidobacteria bacterium]|nr:ATP-binding cassette domain-containing protein [Acidobacteriota bacterium]
MNATSLLSGTGALHTLLISLALIAMVLAILIWVMEFAGWTITRRGFVRSQVSWDATTIAVIAVVAAIYIAGRPLQLQFIPGIGGVNPSMSLAPVFAVLFGLPGAIGVTFSMPIGDAVSGALTVGSAAGFLSHTFITWLPYKLVREPNFKVRAAVISFYVWAIIVGPIIHTIVIPGWLDFTNGLPSAIAWGALPIVLMVNHTLTPAIVAPILIAILYPVVKARGLYWRDRVQSAYTDADDGPLIASDSDIMTVSKLRFKYPTGQEDALKGVSFSVRRGEFLGITGPSGSGKTTLALCMRGLIPHSVAGTMGGSVIVCGLNTRQIKPAATGEKVGLVFQDPEAQIIGLTVAEDLAFGPENYEWPPARIWTDIPEVLRLVRLNGMEGRETFNLSGGQKQRVALAGALMLKPELLILDEPTSELDPVGKAEVFDAVQRLREQHNTTIIMIEHAVEQLAEFADRILMMDGGRIVAEGTPRELFRNVELFHRTGGERIPQVAELMHALEQDGLITSEQYTPYEGEAVQVVSGLLKVGHGR